MTALAAQLVDVDALVHVALYGLVGTLAVVGSFSVLVTAYDHVDTAERPAGWWALMGLASAVCLVIVAVGVWAMTQKP
jgi:hypothetical protein